MTTAVRHNSAHGVRNATINDVHQKGRKSGETLSLKGSSHSTSGGSCSKSEGRDGYTLIGDAE